MDKSQNIISNFLSNYIDARWISAAQIFLEVLIIGYALLWIWKKIRGTQAERLVKGVLVLTFICIISKFLGLTLITLVLQHFIPVVVLALVIIFQPEIRRGLGYLGHTAFRIDFSLADSQKERIAHAIDETISAISELSRTKTGALIVIEPPEGERDYITPGTPINADVSSNLLISIFIATSPLHDGAVVIRQDKIVAAGVILPMTDNPKLSHRYGTRHRAAIGLSEIYDGLCVVVSEETGIISAASRGMLVRYNTAEELNEPISYIYSHNEAPKTESPVQSFLNLFNRKSEEPETDTPTEPAQS